MQRLILWIRLVSKALLLVVALGVGWAFINIAALVKGKKGQEVPKFTTLFGADEAKADAPPAGSKGVSTPFLAYFDETGYKLENDILFGRPKSFHPIYDIAKTRYENGEISPDLYKIAAHVKPYRGKLLFQIQEIELEESFFKWLELKRVLHPANTEVIVDSEYKKFWVVDKGSLEKQIILPAKILRQNGKGETKTISNRGSIFNYRTGEKNSIRLDANNYLEVTFKNLDTSRSFHLVVKSWFRDWVLGLEEEWTNSSYSFSRFPQSLARVLTVLAVFVINWLFTKEMGGLSHWSLLPLVISDCGGATGDTAGDTGSMSMCSFEYEFRDKGGEYRRIAISEPRAWHYNTETIEIPREAILERGELHLRVRSTKRHTIGFIGLAEELEKRNLKHIEEIVPLQRAYHHRLGQDMTETVGKNSSEYLHTIPGDIVDLEFAAPLIKPAKNQKETYVIRASGFYTSLRPESREMAGNWQEKISPEARNRLAALTPLKRYR